MEKKRAVDEALNYFIEKRLFEFLALLQGNCPYKNVSQLTKSEKYFLDIVSLLQKSDKRIFRNMNGFRSITDEELDMRWGLVQQICCKNADPGPERLFNFFFYGV